MKWPRVDLKKPWENHSKDFSTWALVFTRQMTLTMQLEPSKKQNTLTQMTHSYSTILDLLTSKLKDITKL